MAIRESSASAPGVITFPQVTVRKSPLETRMLCEALPRDFPHRSHARSGRTCGRASRLHEMWRTRRQRPPHPGRKDRREVPHPPPRPRPRAPRGTGDPRPCRPAPRPRVEVRTGARDRARAQHRAANPDRVREDVNRSPGTGEPTRSPPPCGVPPGLQGADQHPCQGPARAGEGARPGPPVQGGRARDAGHLHRARAEASREERGRADDAVRRAPGRRHPARTPHRAAHRVLRPQRHGCHVLRRPRRGRADRTQLHPGEDPRRPGHRRIQRQPRRTPEGHRRRHADLRPRAEDKGVPVPEIAKKLTIKVGKNAGTSPSAASLYRALAEAETAAVDDGPPPRPKPVRIRRAWEPLMAEEADLRQRLQTQPHPNAETATQGP